MREPRLRVPGGSGFRWLLLGTSLSFAAFQMASTLQGVVAYELSGSNSAVAAVLFAQGAALAAASPLAGALADNVAKKRLLLVCQAVVAGCFAAVGLMLWPGLLRLPLLAGTALVVGLAFALIRPARAGYVVRLVPAAERGSAVAVTEAAIGAMRVTGPLLAGACLASGVIGAAGAYGIATALMAAAIATLTRIPEARGTGGWSPAATTRSLAEGAAYILRERRVRFLIGSHVLVVAAAWSYTGLVPGLAAEELHRGGAGAGVLLAAAAAGGTCASLGTGFLARSARAEPAIGALALLLALALGGLALAPDMPAAVAAMAAAGAALTGVQTLTMARAAQVAMPEYMGRVAAFSLFAIGLGTAVGPPAGLLADAAGVRTGLLALAALALAAALAVSAWAARLAAAPD